MALHRSEAEFNSMPTLPSANHLSALEDQSIAPEFKVTVSEFCDILQTLKLEIESKF